MDLDLSGKIALVTGASKGIGQAATLRLIEEGASVFACARNQAGLDSLQTQVRGLGLGKIEVGSADMTRPGDIKTAVAKCLESFGRIDILVNNAGSARPGAFLETTDQDWLEDWNLKFFGYMRMAREVFPYMRQQHGGVIVNIIGMGGFMPNNRYMTGGSANAALNHFTKALAQEAIPFGIRVVGINPGAILTDRLSDYAKRLSGTADTSAVIRAMSPMGRAGKPQEVANLIAFLASERAGFINATNVTIDGGFNQSLIN
ncbi:MAG: SDR family oxidoreductase [Candidatus Binataceae bacterium]|nr:SDR family oxidoreductase [Candidatus Binataceae bacterium]